MKQLLTLLVFTLISLAGMSQTMTVHFKAIATDEDGTIASYKWEILSGTGTISSANTAETDITFPIGVHSVKITVTDNQGATGTDNVAVTIKGQNKAPKVDAGPDIFLQIPGTAMNLKQEVITKEVYVSTAK